MDNKTHKTHKAHKTHGNTIPVDNKKKTNTTNSDFLYRLYKNPQFEKWKPEEFKIITEYSNSKNADPKVQNMARILCVNYLFYLGTSLSGNKEMPEDMKKELKKFNELYTDIE